MKSVFKLLFFYTAVMFMVHNTCIAQIQEPLKAASEADIDRKTYTGIIFERYANGSPSLWKTLVNGKSKGLWLEWYPNGILRYRAYWKDSKGNGKWEYFYPNGQLRSESFYIDDIAQGLFKNYYQNGQLKTNATYLNGKKDGMEVIYDVNGIPLTQKRFENGIQVIDEPTIFEEGIISAANANEWGINFTPDGNTAYFTRRDLETAKKRIYTSNRTDKGWSEPLIAAFSNAEDESAFITKDGKKLFFASYRPLPDGTTSQEMDMNIWVMKMNNGQWLSPEPLSSGINKSMTEVDKWPTNYEAGPITDKEGNLYFWTKGSISEGTNLYMATEKNNGNFNTPIELLPPSSQTNYDTAPHLSADETILFFSSDNRYDGYGGADIYYSVKKNGKWSRAKNLGPVINSSYSDGFPSFSPDGKYFYFSSNRGNMKDPNGENIWNLYYMESKFLLIEK